jgi:hypothetical protein
VRAQHAVDATILIARATLDTLEAVELRQALVRRRAAMHTPYMDTQRQQASDTAAATRCAFCLDTDAIDAPSYDRSTSCFGMNDCETADRSHEWTVQHAAGLWNMLPNRTYSAVDHATQLAEEAAAAMEAQLGVMHSVLQCERHAALSRRIDPPAARSTALRFHQVLAVTAKSEPPAAALPTAGTRDDQEPGETSAPPLAQGTAARRDASHD